MSSPFGFDSLIASLITNVLANGVCAVAGTFGKPSSQATVSSINNALERDGVLAPILSRTCAAVARSLSAQKPELSDALKLFLVSPEVEAVARQLYAAEALNEQHNFAAPVRARFMSSLASYLRKPPAELGEIGTELFSALVKGCGRAHALAIDRGILSAHEASSTYRHRVVLHELAAIRTSLEYFTTRHSVDLAQVLEFAAEYRNKVVQRHSHITPPHFDTAVRVPLDDLYVPAHFSLSSSPATNEKPLLSTSEFFARTRRSVILGNPGGGKSTFAQKVCLDVASRYEERPVAGQRLTPIMVVLRNYGIDKRTRHCSLIQFIEDTARSFYHTPPPSGAIEYLLVNGLAVLVFDGLDELLETSYRQEITGDIELFLNRYPSCPAVVTSREVGYEQAPLDRRIFEVFRLAPFDENQVGQYVRKWFSAHVDLSDDERETRIAFFLRESRAVSDLRTNPLLLALMCNIYRGDGYIPTNRPDVYEKCAVMLFERWDRSRHIRVELPFEGSVRPTMQHLAHWIYRDDAQQAGVPEHRLVAEAADYLYPSKFEDRDAAELTAKRFIEFFKGRAWVFTDTGTTRSGERLFQFTHRTFLEYFTAAHLFRTYPTSERLVPVLLPKILKREWDVVAQLAFQLQAKNVEGATDEILNALIAACDSATTEERSRLLSFAARALGFLVPNPRVVRRLILVAVDHLLMTSPESEASEAPLCEIVDALRNAGLDNNPTVLDTVQQLLIARVSSADKEVALRALELAGAYSSSESETASSWDQLTPNIFRTCSAAVERLVGNHIPASLYVFAGGRTTLARILESHGLGTLFRPYRPAFPSDMFLQPPAVSTLAAVIAGGGDNPAFCEQLRGFGELLSAKQTPWIESPRRLSTLAKVFNAAKSAAIVQERPLEGEALFGAALLFGVALELEEHVMREVDLVDLIEAARGTFIEQLRPVFLRRISSGSLASGEKALRGANLGERQTKLLGLWMRRLIDFTTAPPALTVPDLAHEDLVRLATVALEKFLPRRARRLEEIPLHGLAQAIVTAFGEVTPVGNLQSDYHVPRRDDYGTPLPKSGRALILRWHNLMHDRYEDVWMALRGIGPKRFAAMAGLAIWNRYWPSQSAVVLTEAHGFFLDILWTGAPAWRQDNLLVTFEAALGESDLEAKRSIEPTTILNDLVAMHCVVRDGDYVRLKPMAVITD